MSSLLAAAATPTVLIKNAGIADTIGQIATGLLGVAGGLLVYWLGQRSARAHDRQASSTEAAGQLLIALHAYKEDRNATVGGASSFRVMRTAEPEAYAVLRVSAALYVPRLQDERAKATSRHLQTLLATYGWRRPGSEEPTPAPAGETAAEREARRKAEEAELDRISADVEAALDAAEAALIDYLERAAQA